MWNLFLQTWQTAGNVRGKSRARAGQGFRRASSGLRSTGPSRASAEAPIPSREPPLGFITRSWIALEAILVSKFLLAAILASRRKQRTPRERLINSRPTAFLWGCGAERLRTGLQPGQHAARCRTGRCSSAKLIPRRQAQAFPHFLP